MRLRTLLISAAVVVGVGSTSAIVSALAADDALTVAADVTERADRLEAPVDVLPDRPRVFMTFTGSNRLADNAQFDPQWRFVQDNLDGFWGNNSGISADQIARLVRKTDTRRLIGESAFNGSFVVPTYEYVERDHRDIFFEREAITFYTSDPSDWNGRTIADARRAVAQAGQGGTEAYPAVYTGWQPQNFYVDRTRTYPPIRPGSSAERAVNDGDGVFVECPNDVCNGVEYEDGFFRAMRIARQNDQPFVWFASRPPGSRQSGWLAEFQTMYRRVQSEGLWRKGDVIVVVAYDGNYPAVPESRNGQAADTTTGLMYWALNQ